MASGFVPGGQKNEWLEAQNAVEEHTRAKLNEGKQEGGKSLYEVLQQNKAAKQEAFEEAAKLKNQFRSLDDDEVDFLDSILESTRAKEEAVKKETAEQLEVFRKQREEAEKVSVEDKKESVVGLDTSSELWITRSKKRRRPQANVSDSALKIRKLSSHEGDVSPERSTPNTGDGAAVLVPRSSALEQSPSEEEDPISALATKLEQEGSPAKQQALPKASALKLGLANYSSDDDDD